MTQLFELPQSYILLYLIKLKLFLTNIYENRRAVLQLLL